MSKEFLVIDERYQKGKIYIIYNKYDRKLAYIGSTIDTLSSRMSKHRYVCKNKTKTKNTILYNTVDGKWDDWTAEVYELYPCNSRRELNIREGEIIKELGTINKNIAGRTKKQWSKDNPNKNKEYCAKFRMKHPDKHKEYQKNWRLKNRNK
jgi:hypothetical protein